MGRVKKNFQVLNLGDRAYGGRSGSKVCFVWEDYLLWNGGRKFELRLTVAHQGTDV